MLDEVREHIGDQLRERANQLREHPDMWVQATPGNPGEMCAAFDWNRTHGERRVFSDTTMHELERWLPGYIQQRPEWAERFWLEDDEARTAPVAVTSFNDDFASDVDDVIVMLEKAAAELG